MKNSELEQRLKECNYRLSKMDERIKTLAKNLVNYSCRVQKTGRRE